MYATVEPDSVLRSMVRVLADAFPEHSSVPRAFVPTGPTPHCTLAKGDPDQLDRLGAESRPAPCIRVTGDARRRLDLRRGRVRFREVVHHVHIPTRLPERRSVAEAISKREGDRLPPYDGAASAFVESGTCVPHVVTISPVPRSSSKRVGASTGCAAPASGRRWNPAADLTLTFPSEPARHTNGDLTSGLNPRPAGRSTPSGGIHVYASARIHRCGARRSPPVSRLAAAAAASAKRHIRQHDRRPPSGSKACGAVPAGAADFKPVVADTLTVVTSLPGPGFWEGSDTDPTKLTTGYEYDIAKCMEADFGLHKLVVRNGASTRSSRARSRTTTSRSRRSRSRPSGPRSSTFSMPYFQSNQGILMRTGKSDHHARRGQDAQLGRADRDHRGRPAEEDRREEPAHATRRSPTRTPRSGRPIDAVLIDTAINLGEAARSNGEFQVVAQFNQPGGPDQYGAILPKGSANVGAVERGVQGAERRRAAQGARQEGPHRRSRHHPGDQVPASVAAR